ncbi:class I SAM-dependent methyltransferase, partial [bacterium]|nr:class I SAM-dependent methyltransferase [bacterium]
MKSIVSKVLYVTKDKKHPVGFPEDDVEVTYVESCAKAIDLLRENNFDGLYYPTDENNRDSVSDLIHSTAMMELIPDGVALLDSENRILKTN